MTLSEYAALDALGLADLVARKQVTPKELAQLAAKAIAAVNGELKAVVETYADCIDKLDDKTLGTGPFRGVPILMKDVFGHEKGRKVEFGSRLCRGMVGEVDSHLMTQFRSAGVNSIGRSAAPEYSMSATTESLMFGNTSTPWRKGFSAGGSSGGAAASVSAGMVPIAHGSDIGGSIRVPASWCGGVGFKPSRMRVSVGPTVDEGGFGYSMNHIQCRTIRDSDVMLDCISHPQIGDPQSRVAIDEMQHTVMGAAEANLSQNRIWFGNELAIGEKQQFHHRDQPLVDAAGRRRIRRWLSTIHGSLSISRCS